MEKWRAFLGNLNARTHVCNTYRKLDVGSREKLLMLFSETKPR